MMRRTSHHRRSGAERTSQWVGYLDTGFVALASGAVSNRTLIDLSQPATAAGVVAPGRFRVDRIKAQFTVTTVAAAGAFDIVWAGIMVCETLNNVVVQHNPGLASETDASWMWIKSAVLQGFTTAPGNDLSQITWDIDVKVKRVMRPNTALQLLWTHTAGGAASASAILMARTLITHMA